MFRYSTVLLRRYTRYISKSTYSGSEDWPYYTRIAIVRTYISPVQLLVLRTCGTTSVLAQLANAEEAILTRVRGRVLIVTPVADEVEPVDRRAGEKVSLSSECFLPEVYGGLTSHRRR